MTANEMKELLLLKFDGLFESSAPAYSDSQISVMLSNAQRRVVRDVDSPNPQRKYGGFDYNERVKRYLSPLIAGGSGSLIAGYTSLYPNGVGFTLPADCWYVRSERATLNGGSVSVTPVTHDYYNLNINNPYQQPYDDEVWRVDNGLDTGLMSIELIPGSATDIITAYSIVYTTEVDDIVVNTATPGSAVDSILHPDLHDDIVDEAYKIMTGAVNPELYNIANNEANNN